MNKSSPSAIRTRQSKLLLGGLQSVPRRAWTPIWPCRKAARAAATHDRGAPTSPASAGPRCRTFEFRDLAIGKQVQGPAIVESPFTSIVIEPDATFSRTE